MDPLTALQSSQDIVEPLSNVHPLLGVIAALGALIVAAQTTVIIILWRRYSMLQDYIRESLTDHVSALEKAATAMQVVVGNERERSRRIETALEEVRRKIRTDIENLIK